MITSIFPNKILVKDFELDETWNQNITTMAKTLFAKNLAETGNYDLAGDEIHPIFTEENLSSCSELKDLKQMFIDGFYELSESYTTNKLTKEVIESRLENEIGKLPFMSKGNYKAIHNHGSFIDAFAIFYLTTVDPEKDGGELILHDPSFSGIENFHENKVFKITPKKHRMVVCPNHMWHEVARYNGESERLSIVINLPTI